VHGGRPLQPTGPNSQAAWKQNSKNCNTSYNTGTNMEELNVEEMTALSGGGHHHRNSGTKIDVDISDVYITQSNSANVGNVVT
jgi:hypothetical protein